MFANSLLRTKSCRTKKPKGMTQPPLPHPLQLIVVALSVASLSFTMTGGAPVPPVTALLFQSYAVTLAMPVPMVVARAGRRKLCDSMKPQQVCSPRCQNLSIQE